MDQKEKGRDRKRSLKSRIQTPRLATYKQRRHALPVISAAYGTAFEVSLGLLRPLPNWAS